MKVIGNIFGGVVAGLFLWQLSFMVSLPVAIVVDECCRALGVPFETGFDEVPNRIRFIGTTAIMFVVPCVIACVANGEEEDSR